MRAPRSRLARSSSSTSTHAPSPMTNPARVASNGRDARVGSSSSATSPRIAQNPARITRVHAGLGAAREDDVGIATPDRLGALADRVRAGRARGDRRVVRPAQTELDRDLAARRVDEHGRDEERRDTIVAALASYACPARGSRSMPPIAEPTRIPTRAGSMPSTPGVRPRLARGRDGEQDVALQPPRLLRADDRLRLEALAPRRRCARGTRSRRRTRSSRCRCVPATAASQVDGASSPRGVTAPRPVTTTRRMSRRA